MKYSGLILRESLESEACLARLRIVKRAKWPVLKPAPYQPRIWTALSFENDDDSMAETAASISACLKPAWYADMRGGGRRLIIFRDKLFDYVPGDEAARAEAVEHGRKAGIPERQLDWGE